MTPDLLIEKYIALRTTKSAMVAAHEAALRPYDEALDAIETAMLGMLNEQKTDSMKTQFGTAYKKTVMRASMSDRGALVDHALKTHDLNMFTNAVSKDWVKEYLDDHKAPPPGVAIDHITSVGFRKAN